MQRCPYRPSGCALVRVTAAVVAAAIVVALATAAATAQSRTASGSTAKSAQQPVLSSATTAPTAKADSEFKTRARQAILVEFETGAVMYQLNADEQMYPASMSKLMTLELLFKALKSGEVKPDDQFVMSVNAWRTGGAVSKLGTSAMMVPPNTKVRVDELMLGIIVQSGNDAAIAVAEGLGRTEQEFARLMTSEAQRIGMTRSTFRNSTGLFDPEHVSTAHDLATLARHIIREYPDLYPQFATREFRYRTHKFANRNPLIAAGIGVDGMKTGYIKESGYGMVATAVQNERRLIAVVNGFATQQERRDETQRLLEWGFKSFTEFRLFDPGEVVGHARIYGGTSLYAPLTGGPAGVSVILPRFPANQRLEASVRYRSPIKAPIRKGDQIATLRVTSTTKAVNEVPLFATEDIEVGSVWRRGLDAVAHLVLGLFVK